MSEIRTESALSDLIKEFFRQFKDANGDYKYIIQIDRLKEYSSILINTRDFLETKLDIGLELYNELNLNSKEFLHTAERAVREIFSETRGGKIKFDVHIDAVERAPSIVNVLGNEYLNQIVTIKGMVIASSEIFLVPKQITYTCSNGHIFEIVNDSGYEIPKIHRCGLDPKCTSRIFTERPNNSVYTKHRLLSIKSDESFTFTDDELELDVTGDLTEVAQAGDKVKVTGIVIPIVKNHRVRSSLVTLFIQKTDDVDLTISTEDEAVFREFPNQPDFYTRMINSIGSSIMGLKQIKESLLLQRIGSPDIQKNDGTKVRGWFNIGIFGDPSLAKTKLAEWEHTNLVKTIFIMSKGATSTGLLLGLEEGSDGRKRLRAGAMVLCRDDGLVCIDEFPRLSSEVIDGLYTTMDNGIASISKTGHVKSLKANTPILATGNAHTGEWNTALNLQDNLGIPSTFLQRFDYTWVLIDDFDEKRDSALADIILNDTCYQDDEKPHSSTTLSKYIKFVRRFNPQLGEDVSEHLKKVYLDLRKNTQARENGIAPRHLETLKRTTLSIARLFQKSYATVEDADKAIRLLKEMFKQRNISISEADTYVQRNLNKAIEILKIEGIEGLTANDLFYKVLEYGDSSIQNQARADLGSLSSYSENKKWREVIEALKRSPLIVIRQRKPLVLSFDVSKGDLRNY